MKIFLVLKSALLLLGSVLVQAFQKIEGLLNFWSPSTASMVPLEGHQNFMNSGVPVKHFCEFWRLNKLVPRGYHIHSRLL